MSKYGINSFLKSIISKSDDLIALKSIVENVDSGIGLVDDLIKGLKVYKINGVTYLGGLPLAKFTNLFKVGNFRNLFKKSLTPNDERALKEILKNNPEVKLEELGNKFNQFQKSHIDIDIKPGDVPKALQATKDKINKIEKAIINYYKPATVLSLTIGSVVVGTDWLTKTTKEREGCFMFTNINNKLSSCKISNFTCSNAKNYGEMCSSKPVVGVSDEYYNLTIVFLTIASLPTDNKLYKKLSKELEIKDGSSLFDHSDEILKTKLAIVDKFYNVHKHQLVISPCLLKHPSIENGIIPTCRMCDVTADPLSTEYLDPKQVADNITFKCVQNQSILNTVTDVIVSTGVNWLSFVGGNILYNIFKYIGIIAIILIIIGLIVFIIITNKRGQNNAINNNNNRGTSYDNLIIS